MWQLMMARHVVFGFASMFYSPSLPPSTLPPPSLLSRPYGVVVSPWRAMSGLPWSVRGGGGTACVVVWEEGNRCRRDTLSHTHTTHHSHSSLDLDLSVPRVELSTRGATSHPSHTRRGGDSKLVALFRSRSQRFPREAFRSPVQSAMYKRDAGARARCARSRSRSQPIFLRSSNQELPYHSPALPLIAPSRPISSYCLPVFLCHPPCH